MIYLCFPIWAGGFPPAVRSFVQEIGRRRIIAVPTSKSSRLSEPEGFLKVIEVIGLKKHLGDKQLIEDLSFTIPPGWCMRASAES